MCVTEAETKLNGEEREPKGMWKCEKGDPLGMNTTKHVAPLHENFFMKHVAKNMDICQ